MLTHKQRKHNDDDDDDDVVVDKRRQCSRTTIYTDMYNVCSIFEPKKE